ncbi:MAG: hypothetical protein ABIP16_03620, partial [Thermomonas sp.]
MILEQEFARCRNPAEGLHDLRQLGITASPTKIAAEAATLLQELTTPMRRLQPRPSLLCVAMLAALSSPVFA